MITREGIVKIADLGIAKTFEEAAPSAKEHRRIMGTPHYMAPEQALGKAIDHRVDIYSLGATFYHTVTGSTPFTGSTAHEVLKAHIQESLPPIQDLNANVPDPVCFIIERMMAKLPEKRYPDMSKVIEDIERVQRGVIAGIHRIEAGDSTIMRALRAKSAAAQKPKAPDDSADEAATGAHAPVNVGRMAMLVALVFAAAVAIVLVVFKNPQNNVVISPTGTSTSASTDTAANTGTGTSTSIVQPVDNVAIKLLNEAKDLRGVDRVMAKEKLQDIIKNHGPAVEIVKAANVMLAEIDAELKKADREIAQAALTKAEQFEKDKPDEFQQAINLYSDALKVCGSQQDLHDKAAEKIKELQSAQKSSAEKNLTDEFEQLKKLIADSKNSHDYDSVRPRLQKFIADHPTAKQKEQADAELKTLNEDAQALFDEAKKKAEGKDVIEEASKVWDEYNASVKDLTTVDLVNKERDAIKARATALLDAELKKANKLAMDYNYTDAIKITDGLIRKLKGDPGEGIANNTKSTFVRLKKFNEDMIKLWIEQVEKSDGGIVFDHKEKNFDVQWKITRVTPPNIIGFAPKGSEGEIPHKLATLAPPEQYEFHRKFAPDTVDSHTQLMDLCLLLGLSSEADKEKKLIKPK
jgi:hypothetical protein